MSQKGFIAISLLIAIIISVVAVTTVTIGVVLHKTGRLKLTANISEPIKEDTKIVEELEVESQLEEIIQEKDSQSEQELKQARLEAKKAQAEVEKTQSEVERLRVEQEAQRIIEEQKQEESLVEDYSKLNPAPLLTAVTVKGEYDSHIYKWKITVLEFLRGSQALSKMQEKCKTAPHCCWDLENVAPSYEYLLVRLEAKCVQGFIFDKTIISKPQCINTGISFGMGFTIVSSDEKEFSTVNQICYGTNLGRPYEEGVSSTDWLAFRVFSDNPKLLLRYTDFSIPDFITIDSTAWFQIY